MGAAKSLCRRLFVAALACSPLVCGGCSCARQDTAGREWRWGFFEEEPDPPPRDFAREREDTAALVKGIQEQRAKNEAMFRASNPGAQPRR